MSDDKKPRFFDLEEHSEGPEVIWTEPKPENKSVRSILSKAFLYCFLFLVAAASLYYIFTYLMERERPAVLSPVNSASLPGKLRNGQVKEATQEATQEIQYVERKIKKIVKVDKEIKVKRGDSFLGLLNYFYHGYDKQLQQKVKAANPQIRNFSSLMIGQTLTMPDLEEEKEIIEKVPVNASQTGKSTSGQRIVISDFSGNRNKHWIYIRGQVENKASESQDFIKVNVDYLDDERNVITSDFTYAVGENPLKSGETRKFLIMSRNDQAITNYELYLEYY